MERQHGKTNVHIMMMIIMVLRANTVSNFCSQFITLFVF